jgi:alkane 1-monooxygenase
MSVFTSTQADGSVINYRDQKRWLYLWSLFLPAIPALSVALYFSLMGNWATLIPALFVYVGVPMVDAIFGEDTHNPPESVVQKMAEDRHYSWMVRSAVPIVWISFVAIFALIGTQDLPWWSVAALIMGGASISGNCLTVGHELGHKQNKLDRQLAMWINAVVGYAHFRVEHNRGHHVWVSTPEDPASARMGESVYRFALRELPGTLVRGCRDEAERLKKAGLSAWSWQNEILRGFAITTAAAVILCVAFGWFLLPLLLAHHLIGYYMLTQTNYIEHYGLLREKKANGNYEPCRPRHSWNTNHIASNLMTFQLQRHSDHHTNPIRPYQALRDFPDLPRMPSGYPGMFVLAAIPSIFFRVMDPKVMAWAGGDLSKVNVAPHAKARLERKWGSRSDAPSGESGSLHS